MDDSQSNLERAVKKLLTPLIRLLIRSGVGFASFAEWAKAIYVSEAEKSFSIEGKKQTTSRISILTGLHRKDVSRLRTEQVNGSQSSNSNGSNRAERVIQGWLRTAGYSDDSDTPITIPVTGSHPSFESLVQQTSGDMPYVAVLDELKRINAVVVNDEGVSLVSKGYVPFHNDQERLKIMGQSGFDLLNTLEHNLNPQTDKPKMQLTVAYNNLTKQDVEEFERLSRAESEQLLLKLNRWLAARDKDTNNSRANEHDTNDKTRHRAGIGIYYLENLTKDDSNEI
ncbi:DUF6502 family protein [Litoribrevibacter albus]|uniref:Uncharacterized protein n=1 Tax=Litoribrevibacter albus TaxID=1473156 RepID=A0AA37SF15_9GAMM|nr:DUF6502 family protein [Litoribrevibacter albus]GLQ32824.1 hypothetical protein GCM10007876_33030 [Litoribrevibacter albus]